MKKSSILLVILFICISFILNNIYAYELKIDASDIDGNNKIEFYTVVKSSQHSRDYYNEQVKLGRTDEDGFIIVDTEGYGQRSSSYDIVGLVLHTAPLSNYQKTDKEPYERLKIQDTNAYTYSWTSSNVRNVAYADLYDGFIDETSYSNYFYGSQNQKYEITTLNDANSLIVGKYNLFNYIDGSFDYPKYKIVGDLVLFKYEIEKSILQQLNESGLLLTDTTREEGKQKYIYVSLITQKFGTSQMITASQFLQDVFASNSTTVKFEKYLHYSSLLDYSRRWGNNLARYLELDVKQSLSTPEQIEKDGLYRLLTTDPNAPNVPFASAQAMDALLKGLRTNEETAQSELNKIVESGFDPTQKEGWDPYVKGVTFSGDYSDVTTWKFTYQRGYSGINDYDNRLYIPDEILEESDDKKLYVNYLEETKSGELSVLYVAPKEQPEDHQISMDSGATYESINLSKYKDYIVKTNSNEYEEYKIPVEYKKKKFRFVYMTEAELNAKMNENIEDEEEQYKYKYIKLKYLAGSGSDTYELLRDSILNGQGSESTSKKANKTINDSKPFLVSFIYKNTNEKTNIQVQVQHRDIYLNPLPIADGGNEYYENNEYIEKEDISTKYITVYKGNSKADNAYTKLLTSTYIDSDTEKEYNYNGTVRIDAYKPGSEQPDYSKKFSNTYSNFRFSTSGYANSGYTKIIITYFYEPKGTPPPGDNGELEVCPILSFTSSVSSEYNNCDSQDKFGVTTECMEDDEKASSALMIPTEKDFQANLETEKYYIDEEFGIIQKVTTTTAKVEILIEYEEYEIDSSSYCAVCGGLLITYGNKKTYTLDSEELAHNKQMYDLYTSMCKKPMLPVLNIITIEQLDNRVTEPNKIHSTYSSTCKNENCNDGVTSNGSTCQESYHCHGSTEVGETTSTFAVFEVTYIKIDIVGFKSHYLGNVIFDNVINDGTKFIGGDEEKYSVLQENPEDFFHIDNYKFEMLEALQSKYQQSAFVSTPYCGDVELSEINCEGWQSTTVDGIQFPYQVSYYDEQTGKYSYDLGIMAKMYTFTPKALAQINEEAHQSIKSKILTTVWDKYNGERLSVAKLTYHNYNWNYNESLEGEENSNSTSNVMGDGEKSSSTSKTINGVKVFFEESSVNPFSITVGKIEEDNSGNVNYNATLQLSERVYNYDDKILGTKDDAGKYSGGTCSDEVNSYQNVINNPPQGPFSNAEQSSSAWSSYNAGKMQKEWEYFECVGKELPSLSGKTAEELKQIYNMNALTTAPDFYKELGSQYLSPTNLSYSSSSISISSIEQFDSEILDLIFGRNDLYTVEEATSNVEVETNSAGINIMNPAALESIYVTGTKQLVSQTLGGETAFTLQVGAETTIVPRISQSDPYKLTLDERKNYIGYYVYEFNFPVKVTSGNVANQDSDKDGIFNANEAVVITVNTNKREKDKDSIDEISGDDYYDYGGAITIIPTGEESQINYGDYLNSKVKLDKDTIYCTAVTKNVPGVTDIVRYYTTHIHEKNEYDIKTYVGIYKLCSEQKNNPVVTNNSSMTTLENLREAIRNDSRYFSNRVSLSTVNISRLYDFRITDCTDVNFKNVFRKSSSTTVNEHSGTVYFAGIRSLDVYTNTYSKKSTTIPLGPYKNTNSTYVEAPKLGYRISFDLKTSGYYRPNSGENRTIVIFPKLYYISKDGTQFIEDVKAYYKDSTGKYVKIDQATNLQDTYTYTNVVTGKTTYSGYEITYIPNDGYRNVLNRGITSVDNWFSTNRHTLNMSAIKLTNEMMCTNDDGFIQTWYGEYKLPNSTILVKEGETNLNNYLKDGYCGVIFYIGVVEQRSNGSIVMSYNTSDKKAPSQYNTTQWDYEGFLGFSNPGSALNGNLKLQLARGTWNINDSTYQKIKGTVILYDLDNRAASDFD